MGWTVGLASKSALPATSVVARSARRRLLCLSGALVAAGVEATPSRWAHAAQPSAGQQRLKTFVSDDSGFKFAYPEGWAIAIDRNGQQVPGILVTAGDFNRAITLNVSRLPRLADANPAAVTPAAAQGDAFRAQLQAAIVKQLASQPGVFDFDVLSTAERQAGGEFYMDVEYEVSTCRGEIIEGLRGRKRCAGRDDSTIPTPKKHLFQTFAVGDGGYVLTAAAGTMSDRWEVNREELIAAAMTFRVT